MTCSRCHSENPPADSYCGKCGHALTEEVARLPRYRDRRVMIRRELVALIAGLSLVLAAAFGGWYFAVYQTSPAAVVRGFMEADRAGDYLKEQEYVRDGTGSRLTLSLFQEVRKQLGSSPFQKARLVGSSGGGPTSFVEVVITVPTPALPQTALLPPRLAPPPGARPEMDLNLTFVLVRERDVWKIDPAQTMGNVVVALGAAGYQKLAPALGFPGPAVNPNPGGAPAPALPLAVGSSAATTNLPSKQSPVLQDMETEPVLPAQSVKP